MLTRDFLVAHHPHPNPGFEGEQFVYRFPNGSGASVVTLDKGREVVPVCNVAEDGSTFTHNMSVQAKWFADDDKTNAYLAELSVTRRRNPKETETA